MGAPDTAVPRPRSDFVKFWLGQTVSQLGSSFTQFALPLLVYKQTGSALDLGIAAAVNIIPYLLFGLVLGAWVDRNDRKTLMIGADLGRGVMIATIPILALVGTVHVGWIYVVGFVNATLTIVFEAGEFATLPRIVSSDDLVTANGRIQATYSGAAIVGPVLAGVMVAASNVTWLLAADAISFGVSAMSLAALRTSLRPEPSGEGEGGSATGLFDDVRAGLRYVFGHPTLRSISMMLALVNLVAAATYAQLVLMAKVSFGASDAQVSWLYAAGGAGVVVLSLAAGPIRRRLSFRAVALGAITVEGGFTVAFSFTQSYGVALILWAGCAGFAILFNIAASGLRQSIVPNHMLGRVMTIASVLAWSAIPIGSLVTGSIIEATHEIAWVYRAIGIVMILIPIGFSFSALGKAELASAADPATGDPAELSNAS